MTRSWPRSAAGFTLLEVMLAFVVLATAMGLLVGMLANGLKQVHQAQGETEATLYAQSLLDQLGVLEPLATGSREGGFDKDRYFYRLEISEAQDPVPLQPSAPLPDLLVTSIGAPVLYRIVLDVRWGSAQPAQQLRFVTLRARVPLAAATEAGK